jgi:hypothetical protein
VLDKPSYLACLFRSIDKKLQEKSQLSLSEIEKCINNEVTRIMSKAKANNLTPDAWLNVYNNLPTINYHKKIPANLRYSPYIYVKKVTDKSGSGHELAKLGVSLNSPRFKLGDEGVVICLKHLLQPNNIYDFESLLIKKLAAIQIRPYAGTLEHYAIPTKRLAITVLDLISQTQSIVCEVREISATFTN